MSEYKKSPTDFEVILESSYELAVQHRHEYVTVEHVFLALLDTSEIKSLIFGMGIEYSTVKEELLSYLKDSKYHSTVDDGQYQPKYTTSLMFVIKQSKTQSFFMGKNQITMIDIFVSILNVDNSYAKWLLSKNNVNKTSVSEYLSSTSGKKSTEKEMDEPDAIMVLSQFAVNLNSRSKSDESSNPLIGRDDDIVQLVENMSRRLKKSVVLVGEPGVGKTQLVEGLAKRISLKQVPKNLQDQEIWSIDINGIVAGTKFRGDFEERMKALISAAKSLPRVILFIDEIHMLMGAGSGGGSQGANDAANILKPALGRGEIRVIGSTTNEEFRKYFERDRALMRRFQRQDIAEPSPELAKKILQGLIFDFEKYHGVKYSESCANAAVDLSVKHIMNRCLPDKAIDLIDAAGAAVKIRNNLTVAQSSSAKEKIEDVLVQVSDIEYQVSKIAKVALESIDVSDSQKLQTLESSIKKNLMGQDSAVDLLCDSVIMAYSGLRNNNRTMGSFLLTGPSGVGKTSFAQLLAQNLGYSFQRFDMSEFQEPHSVSRFIGSPPGYVGYNDGAAGGGALINAIESTPSCILLIDEVEKAHPDVLNIFLQAMDRGEITSQNQKTVSLRNVFLIFTSNLGASAMEKHSLGFGSPVREGEDTAAVKRFFSPEFRNRLDAIIPFAPLSKSVMRGIVDKFIDELNKLSFSKNVTVLPDEDAKNWLAEKGYDPSLGARPLGRVIDADIKKPMSREILFGSLTKGGKVVVSVNSETKKLVLNFEGNVE